MKWNTLPTEEILQKTVTQLEANGFHVHVVENGKTAKDLALEILPKGSQVMNMTSVTLDTIGLSKEIEESGRFEAAKPKLYSMDRSTQGREMQIFGAAPEWSVGSVHAVTQDGHVLVASNTGSQLPGYSYGSDHVLWVVGAQKVVETVEDGMKRVHEYCLPLESKRAQKAYGTDGSFVSKLLIFYREVNPKRIHIILVKEALGY